MEIVTREFSARGSSAAPNPETCRLSPLADALADDIARSLYEGWKFKQKAALKPQRPGELLHQFFEYTHNQWPHHVVLSTEGEEMAYSELELRSNQLAHFLRQQDITPETRVGICLPRSMDAYIALLALLKTGGRYVLLDPQFRRERIHHMTNDTKLAVIITDAELGLREDEVCMPLIISPDRGHNEDTELPTDPPDHDARGMARDICYIIYTSNTAERPKGIAVEPRMNSQMLRSLLSQQNGFGLQALTLFGRHIEGFLGVA